MLNCWGKQYKVFIDFILYNLTGFTEWLCAKHYVDIWGYPHAGRLQHAYLWRWTLSCRQSETQVRIHFNPIHLISWEILVVFKLGQCGLDNDTMIPVHSYKSLFIFLCYVFRDNNKPINILTGIDYWLDNLMCNVPELVMCFHVNGIVQVNMHV